MPGCVYAVGPGCSLVGFQHEFDSGATAECGHRLYLEREMINWNDTCAPLYDLNALLNI